MTDQHLELLADYAALRVGCERALALLQDPDASDFDAWKVMYYLIIDLKVQK
jgi:hypothetical protein